MQHPTPSLLRSLVLSSGLMLGLGVVSAHAQAPAEALASVNDPGVLEPVTSHLEQREVRIPNTDQSVDGVEQSTIVGEVVFADATDTVSLLDQPIARVTSPNDDLRIGLQALVQAASVGDRAAMDGAAQDLLDILMGTTTGRIYDGFSMLNIHRGAFVPDHEPGEYKTKTAKDSGERFVSPFDGEERRIWEVDINMLFYDGQIDSDTFFVVFPYGHHDDDTLRVNYRIYSLVEEDFSPTLVMLDKRRADNTVQFPFKGFDAVWVAFLPGQVVDLTVDYPPIRMVRGIYTWGWREHPPRIQFMQPLYEIQNVHTGEIELDPQGFSYAYRNRTELTLDTVGAAAPEKKMHAVAQAVLDGLPAAEALAWLLDADEGPRGTWVDWADLVKNQRQLPPEAWDVLAAEDGLAPGDYGPYDMISVYLNNEMYGEGPATSEIRTWDQGDTFSVKLINLDAHTHYFRNVDFGPRLSDDILQCCGGGLTSFEIMNFKPSYGAPKVAEMQWRAGWGFRPHYDVIQQQEVFPRTRDNVNLTPYTGGFGDVFTGYLYSEAARGGDFRFNPPPFIVSDEDPPYPLRDHDGEAGLIIGQLTEGYGTGQMCPGDPYPGFCAEDIAAFNPHGKLNWPPPPLQGVTLDDGTVLPDEPTELRFPPFLRNPSQQVAGAGDIIPPTASWRPFLWFHPSNGTLYNDPDDPSKGFWADYTYSHGAPVFAGASLDATIELPRASGQVFYQFDDLFHDNAIFSPHPIAGNVETENGPDTVEQVRAWRRGDELRVRGRLGESIEGPYAAWVTLFAGSAGNAGCVGTVLGHAEVSSTTGHFTLVRADSGLGAGDAVCVQSILGGVGDAAVP